MSKYLLDTNICIYIMNEHPFKVVQKFKRCGVGDVGVSSITVSELMYGVSKSKNYTLNKERVDEFLAPLEILPYDELASGFYGSIRFRLEERGKLIGPLDLLIAAHAVSRNLVLITNNEKEFRRIKGLKVENWT